MEDIAPDFTSTALWSADFENAIRFHEPTTLLALDSILPKGLPPPISLDETENHLEEIQDEEIESQTNQPLSEQKKHSKKLYFRYFTITEIIIMILGTLITSVFIFLILELY